jgi:rubrerythrin
MVTFSKKKEDVLALIELLGQTYELEYSLIVDYPRLAHMIKDENTRELTISLGTASIKHADAVAEACDRLGATPISHCENIPEGADLIELFIGQLAKEHLALKLHRNCAELAQDENLKLESLRMANEEMIHIRTAEKIVFNLNQGADKLELSLPSVATYR